MLRMAIGSDTPSSASAASVIVAWNTGTSGAPWPPAAMSRRRKSLTTSMPVNLRRPYNERISDPRVVPSRLRDTTPTVLCQQRAIAQLPRDGLVWAMDDRLSVEADDAHGARLDAFLLQQRSDGRGIGARELELDRQMVALTREQLVYK